MKPSTGSVTTAPIAAPSPIVDASRKRERVYAGSQLLGRGRRGRRSGRLVGDGARLRLDVRHLVADVARDVARPEEPEHDGDDRADRGDDPADDEPEEEARDPDRERDRPEARPGSVRGVVARVAQVAPCGGFNRPAVRVSTT